MTVWKPSGNVRIWNIVFIPKILFQIIISLVPYRCFKLWFPASALCRCNICMCKVDCSLYAWSRRMMQITLQKIQKSVTAHNHVAQMSACCWLIASGSLRSGAWHRDHERWQRDDYCPTEKWLLTYLLIYLLTYLLTWDNKIVATIDHYASYTLSAFIICYHC